MTTRKARRIERQRKASLEKFEATALRVGLVPLDITDEDLAEIRAYDRLQHQINAKEGAV